MLVADVSANLSTFLQVMYWKIYQQILDVPSTIAVFGPPVNRLYYEIAHRKILTITETFYTVIKSGKIVRNKIIY